MSAAYWGGGKDLSQSWQLWELNAERLELVEDILGAWERQCIDVVICPGMPMPAQPSGYPAYLQQCISYTLVYNMLDFPAGSIPVSPFFFFSIPRLYFLGKSLSCPCCQIT
jgi:Asp-tRNA(Asn)/Glu-tRNA(Gln) amidotransferase A subunit family amidase